MAWRPIVVGVDDTPESRAALELAAKIASAAPAPLVAVHAIPDLWLVGGLDQIPPLLPEVRDMLMRDTQKRVEGIVREVVPPAIRPRLEVRAGAAAMALAEVARERNAELVVLGGREHGPLARGLGRSTAHYLVRTLDVPVLVAGPSHGPIGRVLVAVDGSDATAPTLLAAERLAKVLGARIRIVFVVEPLRLMYIPVAPFDQAGFEQRLRDAFDRAVASLPVAVPEEQVVRRGAAAETIAEEAASWHADLLVMGSHGKGWMDRMLVGSTTERLLNVLPTSLVVIPTGTRAPRVETPRRRPRKRTRRAKAAR